MFVVFSLSSGMSRLGHPLRPECRHKCKRFGKLILAGNRDGDSAREQDGEDPCRMRSPTKVYRQSIGSTLVN